MRGLQSLTLTALLTTACGIDFDSPTIAWDTRWGAEGMVDVYTPRGQARDRPGVVILHHGGWTGGDKSTLNVQAQRLARAGFVVGNANYRLAPKARFPAPLQDVRCVLSFLRARAEEFHLDPRKIAVLGYSAGAHLAEMSGLTPDLPPGDCPHPPTEGPAAVVAGAGPVDLLALPSLGDGALQDLIGKSKAEAPESYRAASPLRNVKPGAPPYLLVHGSGDIYVPSAHAWAFRDALAAQGNQVELLLLDGSGHSFNPGSEPGAGNFGDLVIDSPEAWPVIIDFLHRTIGRPAP